MNSQFDILSAIYNDTKNQKYDYAVLPWGATEPHNYHLPYLTDCYLAHYISVDAVKEAYSQDNIRGMVLPPIPLGAQNPGQRELPFCLHTRYETQKAILTDIVSSLDCQGIQILIIVNGHGGNNFKNMIRDLAVDYPHFLIVVSDWFAIPPQKDFFEEKDDHAGEMETSVLMHYRPELVDLSLAGEGAYSPFKSESLQNGTGWTPRNWAKVSQDTGIGNPKKSSAQKGKLCAEDVSKKLAALFRDLVKGEIY
ncbi:creatininase family protein [Dysgonomonas sp. Marseille-P4677]|uniref:creatininase family protein n=1 Tax=Dysgonomonas sp. Marseille-P4677 TaxID=2364790 RepID=UPI001912B860|nr:creatininase family protein [Dysgonomonas sp. Marseille-P4677]MBK5719809.1 creatininase family protein [Dysgonomonas sp. Marseille-P4677]